MHVPRLVVACVTPLVEGVRHLSWACAAQEARDPLQAATCTQQTWRRRRGISAARSCATGGSGETILVSQSPVPPDAMYIGAMGSLVNFKTGLQAWIHVRA
jgi:hypothetical protein